MADVEKQNPEHRENTEKLSEELQHARTVDTIHQDEALKVLAQYTGEQTWTAQEEKKLVRRIDRKLIPILCCTYGLQYYDKAMLSQAVSPPKSQFRAPVS